MSFSFDPRPHARRRTKRVNVFSTGISLSKSIIELQFRTLRAVIIQITMSKRIFFYDK